jgi:hypothetical protein
LKVGRSVGHLLALLLVSAAQSLPGVATASGQPTASRVEPPRTVDRAFRPVIENPAYQDGSGPTVLIDETHNNFHTAIGTYAPFASVLREDGYAVDRAVEPLSEEVLGSCAILVVADAQPPARHGDPPTFSLEEIARINHWVRDGGALFLITDHMPDPSAIAALAASFGVEFHNGYVLNGYPDEEEKPLVFRRSDRTLADHPLTGGRGSAGRVGSVATFTGSAFRAGEDFQPLLIFGSGRRSWAPETYWEFPAGTPSVDVTGWYQGGVMRYGKGRVAVFAEAAMFTAQVFDNGRVRAGMNHPLGRDNLRLLLNVMHWLSGRV